MSFSIQFAAYMAYLDDQYEHWGQPFQRPAMTHTLKCLTVLYFLV